MLNSANIACDVEKSAMQKVTLGPDVGNTFTKEISN